MMGKKSIVDNAMMGKKPIIDDSYKIQREVRYNNSNSNPVYSSSRVNNNYNYKPKQLLNKKISKDISSLK